VAETYSRFACLLALVAVIAATLGPVGLQVLCVGEDGHRAIELAHGFASCESDAASGHAPLDHHDRVRADGSGCTDFALGLDIDVRTARVHDGLLATLAFPPLLVYQTDDQGSHAAGLEHRRGLFQRAIAPGSAQPLRTTVLLL